MFEGVEGPRSPMLESPESSDDEDFHAIGDSDSLDLVGCTRCGETFENIDDLNSHHIDCCAPGGAGKHFGGESCSRY